MKSVPFAALALALMATTAMAQPRHGHDQDQDNNAPQRPARAEQPRQAEQHPAPPQAAPQAAQPPRAQFQRGESRQAREVPPAQPAAAPSGVDRRDFTARRGEAQVAAAPAPQLQARAIQAEPPRQDSRQRYSREPQAGPQTVNPPAQSQNDRRQFQGDPRGRDGRDRTQSQSPQPQAPQPSPQQRYDRGGDRGGRDNHAGDANGWNRDGGRGGWDQSHRGPQERPNWARPDGRRDRDHDRPRYDQRRYPQFFRIERHYRAPYYVAPYGFYDYDWAYGDYLPWGWYGPSYWIEDWFAYGLPIPPVGCEWVRVGRDALLIDTYDGRVLSVARLLFW